MTGSSGSGSHVVPLRCVCAGGMLWSESAWWATASPQHSIYPRRKVRAEPMTDVQFTAAITHEGDWYVARCLQVEVTSQGETVESALANLREASRCTSRTSRSLPDAAP